MSGIKQTNHIGCENVGQRIPNVSIEKKTIITLSDRNMYTYQLDLIYEKQHNLFDTLIFSRKYLI